MSSTDDDMTSSESEASEHMEDEVEDVVAPIDEAEEEESSNKKFFVKEIWQLKKLPYCDDLEAQADRQLIAIKRGINHAILLNDPTIGLVHWALELEQYMDNNLKRFSKEELITFVKVFIPMVRKGQLYRDTRIFMLVLNGLLDKKENLSRDDIVIDWRPLFEFYYEVQWKKLEEDGLFYLPVNLKQELVNLISNCRQLFAETAVQEILDECRPAMCLWDEGICRAFKIYEYFIPTNLKPEVDAVMGSKLWFDEFWHFFSVIDNNLTYDNHMFRVFSRMVRESPGQLDWTGKVDFIFTKLLRSLHLLPLPGHQQSLPVDVMCNLVVYMLNTNVHDDVIRNIRMVINQVESFLYPSNSGKHTPYLLLLLTRLLQSVLYRVKRERTEMKKKVKNVNLIPEAMKLKEEQIHEFVSYLIPLMKLALFTKTKNEYVLAIFKVGSLLAPKLVLPLVTDQIYPALETLIEPHRLLQTLTSYLTVLVALVKDRPDENGKSYRIHAINVLHSMLPGLDRNDSHKCMLTFQVLGVLLNLIPVVDNSDAVYTRDDLIEEEKELCSATAGFDSIIGMIMDRILEMIVDCGSGSAAGGHCSIFSKSASSVEDSLLQRGSCTVFKAITKNSSTPLFKVALDKLYTFACEQIFDSIGASNSLSDMISYACKLRPELSFPKFLKLTITKLQACITPETYDEEKVDFTVIWWLTLADRVVRVSAQHLVKHWKEIRILMDLIYPFKKCTDAVLKSRDVLESILAHLCSIHMDVVPEYYQQLDKPSDEYLHIRHWGEPVDKKLWNPVWHVPNKEEIEKAEEIMKLYIVPLLDILKKPQGLDKKVIYHALLVIRGTIFCAAPSLPFFEGPCIPLTDSPCIHPEEKEILVVKPNGTPEITIDGKNVRQEVLDAVLPLIDYLLEHTPDDVKSIQEAISILRFLPNNRGVSKPSANAGLQRFISLKSLLCDNLAGNRGNVLILAEEYLSAVHKKREASVQGVHFKQQHLDILRKLIKVSTSTYSQNRTRAQLNLSASLKEHAHAYKLIIDDLLYYLNPDNNPTHEQLKGALYCLVDGKKFALSMRVHFGVQSLIWPAIVNIKHSDKPSVINLLEENRINLIEGYETYRLNFEWQQQTLENAQLLLTCAPTGSPLHCAQRLQPPTADLMAANKNRITETFEQSKKDYYKLVQHLFEQANDPERHWRPVEMAHTMLSMLIRRDLAFPENAVKMFVRLLVHDSIQTRNRAAALLSSWLKINKPKAVKREYVIKNKEPNTSVGAVFPITYGIRDDNRALMYEEAKIPQTDEEFDEFQFCGKQHWGLYTWPKKLITYAPLKEQKAVNRSPDEFSETEKYIVNTFKNPDFLRKFKELYTVEDRKRDHPFDSTNYALLQGIFRSYGEVLCAEFKELLETLMLSSKEKDQSFAAEIASAMINGAKLWYWSKQRKMWSWMAPMLSRNLETLTEENLRVWGEAMATVCASSEARMLKPLIDVLFDLITKPSKNVASSGARLFLIHSGLSQFEWRAMELLNRLKQILQSGSAQQYANLRDKIASCLASCVWFDLPSVYVSPNLPKTLMPPKIDSVVNWYLDNMSACIDEVKLKEEGICAANGQGMSSSASTNSLTTDSEVKKTARSALKGSVSFFFAVCNQSFDSLPPSFIQLLPMYAHYANDIGDEELYKTFHSMYADFLNSVLIVPENLESLIVTVTNTLNSRAWWKTKVIMLEFFSTVVFSNPFMFRPHMNRIAETFMLQLSDCQVEVREMAAKGLSLFLGAHFVEPTEQLIDTFWRAAHLSDAIHRHGGVLGLASIVKAYPYNVPKFLPDVLMKLCRFVSYPQPVMDTVKKTFSEFKRTHQDSWREHEMQFDEEQLMVLRDILVSPNYYV